MRIYLAGTTVSNPDEEKEIMALFNQGHKLHSFFHCSHEKGFEYRWYNTMKKNKVDLFLDSGAFSAWSQGGEIDIQEYIAFIKKHEQDLEVYANLDVIGDAEGTWKNQKIMEDAGLNPLPVYHYGAPEKWLTRYLKAGYDYIALGGMVPITTGQLQQWLDRIFSDYLTDESGMPVIRVHGFGLTSLRLMLRYPWYSVDSTSWVMTGRMGSIYVPRFKNGQWVYDEESWKVAVSNRSPGTSEAGKHFLTLTQKQRELVLEYMSSKGYEYGESEFRQEAQDYSLKDNEKWAEKKPKDKQAKRRVEVIKVPGVSNKYQLRDEMNIIYFMDLEKTMPAYPWAMKKQVRKGFGF